MAKARSSSHDALVIGDGVAAALTALTLAAGGKRKRSVCLLGTGNPSPADVVAASYALIDPHAFTPMGIARAKVGLLTDGALRGMTVAGVRDAARAQYVSRSVSGCCADGARLLRGLLSLCRSAGVTLARGAADARCVVADGGVEVTWSGGRASGRVGLLTDLDAGVQADSFGLRQVRMAGRLARCYGTVLPSTPARMRKAFGASPALQTVWQLDLEGFDLSPEAVRDSHAWVLPRKDAAAVGLMISGERGESVAPARVEQLMTRVLAQLREQRALPVETESDAAAHGPIETWQLPPAAALEIESHVGKRSLALGLMGGFVAALSGQWIGPTVQAAAIAGLVLDKAAKDPRLQDQLGAFSVQWRQKMSDRLRSPNTRLAFLLPLAFANQQIADRFCRAYLFGENF
ncbi:MAG: hypothetical protein BIFFINMI_04071 [Phycisphaerae bacterium]|nr:hypothetical protein [Phycisphaerae bacterium]